MAVDESGGSRCRSTANAFFNGQFPDRLTTPIPLQQLMGSPGQHSPDLPPFALDPWNHHAIVAGRLVPHPGDHGSFGPLLDRNALRPGDGAAPDRRGMIGHGPCHPVGKIGVIP